MTTPVLPSQYSDFPAWYGEVVRRTELAENSPVRGAMVIEPHGRLPAASRQEQERCWRE